MMIDFEPFKKKYLTSHNLVGRRFCFILGAGASKTSGIPTGNELAHKWFCQLVDDWKEPTEEWDDWIFILKSEDSNENRKKALKLILKNELLLDKILLNRKFGEDSTYDLADFIKLKYIFGISSNYGALAKANFVDSMARDNEFQQILQGVTPSDGYRNLAEILSKTKHNIAITTNFDSLIFDSFANGNASTLRLDSATDKCPGAFDTNDRLREDFTASGKRLIIKVHGDNSKGGLLNTVEETRYLPDAFYNKIASIFNSYCPIFIGYSGGDLAFMDLLLRYADSNTFNSGFNTFWFVRNDDTKEFPQAVVQFVRKTNGIFVYAPNGFDSVMRDMKQLLCPDIIPQKTGDKIDENRKEISDVGQTKIDPDDKKMDERKKYPFPIKNLTIPRRNNDG